MTDRITLRTINDLREHGTPIGILENKRQEIPSWGTRFLTDRENLTAIARENGITNFGVALWIGVDPNARASVGSKLKVKDLYGTDEVIFLVGEKNFMVLRNWAYTFGREDELYIIDLDRFDVPSYDERVRSFRERF